MLPASDIKMPAKAMVLAVLGDFMKKMQMRIAEINGEKRMIHGSEGI